MGINCVPLLADLSYEAEFIQNIDDVLSIENCYFHTYEDSIYPSVLKIKDTTESASSVSSSVHVLYFSVRLLILNSVRFHYMSSSVLRC